MQKTNNIQTECVQQTVELTILKVDYSTKIEYTGSFYKVAHYKVEVASGNSYSICSQSIAEEILAANSW